ncbi:MAG TPA: hypothetical protein VEV43_12965 [Actinomycetota bacterium]|nr:hypothetical protein [Actinomycetota bacterium]
MPLSDGTAFLFGCIGGALPDVVKLIQSKTEMPTYLKKPWWYVVFVITVALGGLVAGFLLEPNTRVDAVAYGFSALEIIRRIGGSALGGNGGTPGTRTTDLAATPPRVRDYLA